MSLVKLPAGVAGIRAPLKAFPETAKPILDLAQAVLRGPSSLTEAERELIATAVSVQNKCSFCAKSHGAAARVLLGDHGPWVDEILEGGTPQDLPPRLASLVSLARGLAQSCQGISEAMAAECRQAGATERDLHDTVLVAAAFSLFNRYVDGLGAPEPENPDDYRTMGQRLAQGGYR